MWVERSNLAEDASSPVFVKVTHDYPHILLLKRHDGQRRWQKRRRRRWENVDTKRKIKKKGPIDLIELSGQKLVLTLRRCSSAPVSSSPILWVDAISMPAVSKSVSNLLWGYKEREWTKGGRRGEIGEWQSRRKKRIDYRFGMRVWLASIPHRGHCGHYGQ